MSSENIPNNFSFLVSEACIKSSDIIKTSDGFFMVYKSISNILATKNIVDFPDTEDERLACDRFFDDWFLYAVQDDEDYTYSLLKMREQEHDIEEGIPADGDAPGVTISFISFDFDILVGCLEKPTDENILKLSREIGKVVSSRGQRHHNTLKKYFKDPMSQGAYLVAYTYMRHIASMAENGCLEVPEHYKEIVQQSISYKYSAKVTRLPDFIESLNQVAGRVVCDGEKIYFQDSEEPTMYELLAILATHTGNTSVYSFAAEVEYHARFLIPLARFKIPFFGKSIYESAIRADMTIDDTEFVGPAPFYVTNSKIVKRQYELHNSLRF